MSLLLKDEKDIFVGAHVGFPSGAHKTEIKKEEARLLIADGVQEMDLVMNIGKLRSGEYDYVLDEIKYIVDISGDIPLKVIIEEKCLNNDEVKRACELILKGGADFVKTATGWINGAPNMERVKMIKSIVGNSLKIKVAGGIRDLETLLEMIKLGIDRFGINVKSAMEIVGECTSRPGELISF